ncbi:MAG: hypothetical protein IJS28_06930 [Synergistaceae bacterium]|nr:hypothetical protein [Synergistaceae bacterium]
MFIQEYEDIAARLSSEGKPYWGFKDGEANCTMLKAYFNSKETGKASLDFNDTIWDTDIQPIAEAVRRFGISEFTISVRQTNLIDLLAAFQELGITVAGVVKVETNRQAPLGQEEHEVLDALLMKVQPA